MVALIEISVCYLFIGIVYHIFFEDDGESRNAIYKLIQKSVTWPVNMYNKFIKD